MTNMVKKSKAINKSRAEMNKKSAIIKFGVICLITALGILACFVNFRVPFTSERFHGFFGAIEEKMGIDLKGGVLAVFDTEENPTSSQIDATVKRLENLLYGQGYTETTVVRQGTKIRIEVPGMQDTTDLFDAIGKPAVLDMRREDGTIFLHGEHIEKAEYYQESLTKHSVKLTFTKEGGELFRAEVAKATIDVTKILIYLDGEMLSDPTISSKDAGLGNTTIITGSYSKDQAKNMALSIESGLYEAKLTPAETSVIQPTLGEGALTAGIIACVVGLLFIFALMWFRYGDLGLISNLSMLIFTVFFLFLLAVVGSVQLTLPGIAGIILSIAMAVDANIIIFERIKDEYKTGKRMAVAVESGFNKSITTILDANITTILAAAILCLIGTGTIVGFGITLLLGVVVSMFCSLVITRSLAKLYLYINYSNEKRLRLVRDEGAIQKAEIAAAAKNKPRALNLGGEK